MQDLRNDILHSHQVGGSSDEEDEDKNVWVITKEQYSYYVTQFRAMQPNPRGVIPGTQVNNSPSQASTNTSTSIFMVLSLISGEGVL